MRLIDTELNIKTFFGDVPKYAILSDCYLDLTAPATPTQRDNENVIPATLCVARLGFDWLWYDRICIDRASSAELSEAINSMFDWYNKSGICLVYLDDVDIKTCESFTQSKWFSQAWTLQALIAPRKIIFYDKSWAKIGQKDELIEEIRIKTQIPKELLDQERPLISLLERYSTAQKMSWAAHLTATRPEDVAYSLLGIFQVTLAPLYSEGNKAFERLQEEIIRRNADYSFLAWSASTVSNTLFAPSPSVFDGCGEVVLIRHKIKGFKMTNAGLEIGLKMQQSGLNIYEAEMPCQCCGMTVFLLLTMEDPSGEHYYRCGASVKGSALKRGPPMFQEKTVVIRRSVVGPRRHAWERVFDVTQNPNITPLEGWDLTREWGLGEWVTTGPNTLRFTVPSDVSFSVAMLKLSTPKGDLLVQLTWDFDFNPCCNVRKMPLDLSRPPPPIQRDKHPLLSWLECLSGWDDAIYHQVCLIRGSDSTESHWSAKARQHSDFRAVVDNAVTTRSVEVEIAFKWSNARSAWQFNVEIGNKIANPNLRYNTAN